MRNQALTASGRSWRAHARVRRFKECARTRPMSAVTLTHESRRTRGLCAQSGDILFEYVDRAFLASEHPNRNLANVEQLAQAVVLGLAVCIRARGQCADQALLSGDAEHQEQGPGSRGIECIA